MFFMLAQRDVMLNIVADHLIPTVILLEAEFDRCT